MNMSWGFRSSGSGASRDGFSIAELMLPDHLLLRATSTADPEGKCMLGNWPAYSFGVEMLLRIRGLEGHLDEKKGRSSRVNADQWQAEEDLCKLVIGFNVKDFAEVFGSSLLPIRETTAAAMWSELAGRFLAGEINCQHM
ncbi:hypothetical protein BD311DRAFT_748576 [Dichomitus squalens]|uniref:Uncharacterized protein n=1 Tax=Dichomitus squalens TaxID=114155 RepID=A0A4Q9N364_9APHY|nr:hypothetical protein BD311DRAFT_748576 [Dichomitus squalens]